LTHRPDHSLAQQNGLNSSQQLKKSQPNQPSQEALEEGALTGALTGELGGRFPITFVGIQSATVAAFSLITRALSFEGLPIGILSLP